MRFLTPDSSEFSGTPECRKITLPASLWPYIGGALERLTAVYNWDMQGDATPEECTQFFMDIIDDYSASSGQCGMKFIQQTSYNIFSESFVFVPGYSININESMLPSYVANPTAIFCNLIATLPYYGINVEIKDQAGNARQYVRIPQSGANRMDLIIPMSNGGGNITLTATSGDSITWVMNLIGWW